MSCMILTVDVVERLMIQCLFSLVTREQFTIN